MLQQISSEFISVSLLTCQRLKFLTILLLLSLSQLKLIFQREAGTGKCVVLNKITCFNHFVKLFSACVHSRAFHWIIFIRVNSPLIIPLVLIFHRVYTFLFELPGFIINYKHFSTHFSIILIHSIYFINFSSPSPEKDFLTHWETFS